MSSYSINVPSGAHGPRRPNGLYSGMGFTGKPTLPPTVSAPTESTTAISREDALALIASSIAALRVYVVESDITESQNAVKAIVSQSSF
jgi:hypothetical protein